MIPTPNSPQPISIIIPVLNEAETIGDLLAHLQPDVSPSQPPVEIIVVDGGSVDETVAIAKSQNVRVEIQAGGRALQMNRGAALAQAEILLFLHADTRLPADYVTEILAVLYPDQGQKPPVAGAFRLKIDAPLRSLRWIEWGVNLRSQVCQLPYGDQAIFLTKRMFTAVGGFPDLPIMEDFVLIRQLQRRGHIALTRSAVTTSARRWLRQGVSRTTLINQLMIGGYYLGISPQTLARWYRQGKMSQH